jgi:hypothetical protein
VLWIRVPRSTQPTGPPELAPSWAGHQPLLLPIPAAMQARQHLTSWSAWHPTCHRYHMIGDFVMWLCSCQLLWLCL